MNEAMNKIRCLMDDHNNISLCIELNDIQVDFKEDEEYAAIFSRAELQPFDLPGCLTNNLTNYFKLINKTPSKSSAADNENDCNANQQDGSGADIQKLPAETSSSSSDGNVSETPNNSPKSPSKPASSSIDDRIPDTNSLSVDKRMSENTEDSKFHQKDESLDVSKISHCKDHDVQTFEVEPTSGGGQRSVKRKKGFVRSEENSYKIKDKCGSSNNDFMNKTDGTRNEKYEGQSKSSLLTDNNSQIDSSDKPGGQPLLSHSTGENVFSTNLPEHGCSKSAPNSAEDPSGLTSQMSLQLSTPFCEVIKKLLNTTLNITKINNSLSVHRYFL